MSTSTTNNNSASIKNDDPESGSDSSGRQYASIAEMWNAQGVGAYTPRSQIQQVWYDKATDWYEENCPATVDGVLGGFASISEIDLKGSHAFLQELQQQQQQPTLDWTLGAGCECGAGIGRVTKGLLLPLGVTQVDLVESSSRLLCESPEYIGEEGAANCKFYCSGLQDWTPPSGRYYTIIWIQWVLIYLTDDDVICFLNRCADSLLPNGKGVIVVKENTTGDGETFVVDNDDVSVCRSLPYWLKLIEKAGLKVVYQKMQTDFPPDIFPVPMLALTKQ
ncbi:Lys N-methyltransferase 1 [Seminavis robusta]|uniref:Alpha N-terminal protein methyltransferase 1 n=1 Tax=Seminavis robusta TaxID=568900 RepID=A0A9N8DZU8_9STRA|nr:Lys N-methyltransferase 1 [Seminavis robusta]|eukprot:Sro408_g137090.1 Lys N-methyltransferase 1 (278) ;mRNA; r:67930-68763